MAKDKRTAWQVPDPNCVVQEGSTTRSFVDAYKALEHSPGIAEALAERVARGWASYQAEKARQVGSMDRPHAATDGTAE